MSSFKLTPEIVAARFSAYLSPLIKVPAQQIFPPALAAMKSLESEGLHFTVEGLDMVQKWGGSVEGSKGGQAAPIQAQHDPGSEMSGSEPKFNDV